jgi:hypothetical protein
LGSHSRRSATPKSSVRGGWTQINGSKVAESGKKRRFIRRKARVDSVEQTHLEAKS